MGSLVTFSDVSARKVHDFVEPYGVPLEPYLSSRLLNRQCKFAMHKIQREVLKEVLEGLEKSMRQRTKDSWGPSLCAILLLCLCIEGLQIAADKFVVCDIQKSEEDGVDSLFSREQSFAACQNLDEYPFHQVTRLFHDIYRSHKEAGGAREGGFNPFRALYLGEITGLESETDKMARSMDWLVRDSCEDSPKPKEDK